jgi:hypothetical protein
MKVQTHYQVLPTKPPPKIGRGDKPYPERKQHLPRNLEAVTAEWLSSLLQHRYPGVVVRDMKAIDVRNGHTTKVRLQLDLNEMGQQAGIPNRVCLKSNWSEGFDSGDICELEARFYFHIANQLSVPAPKAYYADWDADGSGQGLVVMEDLVADGGRFGHSTDHLGVEGVARALETLARLHGAWWDSPKLSEQEWLPTSMRTYIDNEQLRMMWAYVEANLPKPEYQAILPRWMIDDPQRLVRLFDALALHEQGQGQARCIVHGDSHVGNSYVRADGQRVWLDWQLVRKGHPWRDVTYLMLGALTIEERRASERHLLSHYREALLSTGAQNVIDVERIWAEYRRWPIYGMQSWIANVDAWGQTGLPIVERFFTAAEDLQTAKLLEAGT